MISSEVWRFSKILPGIEGGSNGKEGGLFALTGGSFTLVSGIGERSMYRMNFQSGAILCYTWITVERRSSQIVLMTKDKQLTNKVKFKIIE